MFRILGFIRRADDAIDRRVDEWLEALKDDAVMYPRDGRPAVAIVPPSRPRGAHRRN